MPDTIHITDLEEAFDRRDTKTNRDLRTAAISAAADRLLEEEGVEVSYDNAFGKPLTKTYDLTVYDDEDRGRLLVSFIVQGKGTHFEFWADDITEVQRFLDGKQLATPKVEMSTRTGETEVDECSHPGCTQPGYMNANAGPACPDHYDALS